MTTIDTEKADAQMSEHHSDTGSTIDDLAAASQRRPAVVRPRCMVYMAGPITKPCPLINARRAMLLWNKLRVKEYAPVCPHLSVLQQMLTPLLHEEWLDFDFEVVLRVDAVLRMPGESKGADMEVEFAKDHGIPVVGLGARTDDDAIQRLDQWRREGWVPGEWKAR